MSFNTLHHTDQIMFFGIILVPFLNRINCTL
ncbi:hypothetical protein T01_722 [Trichinella spiralis]|uniref:Uncharacterized protein n=1 Tax=Trichinella spiralis TaxID=6334 RepID=A0A0V0YYA4_TRISP|nr:hypothetical protein T01_15613 [Trichinella spiralis]KRY02909.1 hypothetical protein T01_8536 [Trichinella spiralis]KRY05011.1 hypothetical protein T01_722 [Trichinella spiralis]